MTLTSRMPALSLDYHNVLSAWEKIGGSGIFASDDVQFEGPESVTLDLTGFEATLNPGTKERTFNMFGSASTLFSPAELGLTFYQNVKSHPSSSLQNSWSSQQLVPDNFEDLFGDDSDTEQSEVAVQAMNFKQEPLLQDLGPSPSPSLSSSNSDAAVVPDVTSHHFAPHPSGNHGFTMVPQGFPTPAHMLQLCQQVPSAPHRPSDEYVRTRQECLDRYREKKARRLYTKKIRYQLRKINADKRPRIKGRFVKKEELEQYIKGNVKVEFDDMDEDFLDSDDE